MEQNTHTRNNTPQLSHVLQPYSKQENAHQTLLFMPAAAKIVSWGNYLIR